MISVASSKGLVGTARVEEDNSVLCTILCTTPKSFINRNESFLRLVLEV